MFVVLIVKSQITVANVFADCFDSAIVAIAAVNQTVTNITPIVNNCTQLSLASTGFSPSNATIDTCAAQFFNENGHTYPYLTYFYCLCNTSKWNKNPVLIQSYKNN